MSRESSSPGHAPFPLRGNEPTVLPFAQQITRSPRAELLQMQLRHGNTHVAHLLAGAPNSPAHLRRCGGVVHAGCSCAANIPQDEEQARTQPVSTAPVQRLTEEEKQDNLVSPKYAGNKRLEEVFDNSKTMRLGEPKGEPVRLVQEGLVADGFAMPNSTKPTGELDGVFGNEMVRVVNAFQQKHRAECGTPDGIVGRNTLRVLDRSDLGSNPAPTPPSGLVIGEDKKPKSSLNDPKKIFFLRGSAVIPDTTEMRQDPRPHEPVAAVADADRNRQRGRGSKPRRGPRPVGQNAVSVGGPHRPADSRRATGGKPGTRCLPRRPSGRGRADREQAEAERRTRTVVGTV